MKVLVTGGAGFIGSHVVDALVDAGHEPRIFDVIPSPWHDPGEVDTFIGDMTDGDALRHAVRGCDAIAHLAAIADVNHVAADPVYAELYDVDYTILRFGIPYGPRARPAAVIPQFFKNALAGRPLTIAGGGKQSRRFTYVGDIARGVAVGLAPQARNRVYNLSSDETVTILDLATAVSEIVGDTDILHTPGRAGDFRGVEISNARIARELGWRATTSLAEGLTLYLDWLRAEAPADPDPDPVG